MLVTIDHAADFYNRYPGETVTFLTRITVLEEVAGFVLRVSLPPELTLSNYGLPLHYEHNRPEFEVGRDANYLVWRVAARISPGTSYEYRVEAQIAPLHQDTILESQARVTPTASGQREASAVETVTIAVAAKGRYLNYLPALYYDNDLMARFLMLFESFWKPIEGQIGHSSLYFDPKITTPDFLPWLASLIGLSLDERWSEARQRALLGQAAWLYRRRGTKLGLQRYLEIYTNRPVRIVENRAENFRLGAEARLGPTVALGRSNRPHTFAVFVRLPALEIDDESERTQQELIRQHTIEAIIEAEKPAQTSYTLHLEVEEKG